MSKQYHLIQRDALTGQISILASSTDIQVLHDQKDHFEEYYEGWAEELNEDSRFVHHPPRFFVINDDEKVMSNPRLR